MNSAFANILIFFRNSMIGLSITTFSASVSAAGFSCDFIFDKAFVSSTRFPVTQFFSNDLKKQVQEILSRSDLASHKKWSLVGDLYTLARVSHLPEGLRAGAMNEMRKLRAKFYVDGGEPVANDLSIELPMALYDTGLVAVIEAHECEHVLQKFVQSAENKIFGGVLPRMKYNFSASHIEWTERDAMLSEWAIAQFISDAEVEKIDLALKKPSLRHDQFLKLLHLLIEKGRQLSAEDYLKLQYKIGRYDPPGLRRLMRIRTAVFSTVVAGASGGAWLAYHFFGH